METLSLKYPAKIIYDEAGYTVEFIDFDAFSEGDTLEEALFNAREALDVSLLGYIDTRQDIPLPSDVSGDCIYIIPASPDVATPVLLYKLRKEQNKTISEVADLMNVSFQRYHNIEQGGNITLKTLKRAAAALGATAEVRLSYPDCRSLA